jgi:hypothetical protein
MELGPCRRLMKCGLRESASVLIILTGVCLATTLVWTQTTDSQASDTSKSWSATTEQRGSGNTNPTRTAETHREADGRTVDKQAVERIGPDGRYEPYLDIEKESVKVDASTIRVTQRTFGRDSEGNRVLTQVTEEEKRTSQGGDVKSVRTISDPDANGRLQVVQREIQETKNSRPGVEDTKTTVFTPDINGGLAESMRIQERQKRSDDHTIEFRKSTLLPDGNGSWQVGEVREGVIKDDGKEHSRDEQVLQPDSNGKLSAVARTVSKESGGTRGEKRTSVDSYTTDVPGSAGDGSLHLGQRVTTLHRANPNGEETTKEQVERPNPGDPGGGLRMTSEAIDIVRPGPDGAKRTQTIRSLDANGDLGVVSLEIGRTDKAPAVQVDIAAPDKPKPNQPK